jgi:hypothetical protein
MKKSWGADIQIVYLSYCPINSTFSSNCSNARYIRNKGAVILSLIQFEVWVLPIDDSHNLTVSQDLLKNSISKKPIYRLNP